MLLARTGSFLFCFLVFFTKEGRKEEKEPS
jgi:hypothetical protein